MAPEIVWNGFALVGIVFCACCLISFFVQLPSSLRNNASAKKDAAHDLLTKKIIDAGSKSLDIAIRILAKAGVSYSVDVEPRSLRWNIPKVFWHSEKHAVEKAKALNTVMVAAKKYAGDSAPEIDLHNVLMWQAKRTPLTVIMISCSLTRFNQDFNRWFCQD